jgi:vitamin B12/bleomycin/antimicrobial peptide transport system ATP-binding/permease protein
MSMSAVNVFAAVARLSKGFWLGPQAARAWMLTIGAFALALLDVGVQVALNHWTKDFYDAIERRSVDLITSAAFFFALLIVTSTAVVVLGMITRQLLQIDWRQKITERLLKLWLTNQAFYRLNVIRTDDFAPEHRIAEDARLTVEPIVDLVIGFLTATVTFVAFVGILWKLGGSITVAGVDLPGFMVLGAVAYALSVSLLMMIVGSSYAQRVRDRSEAEAQLRYELTHLRENAESIALVRGELGQQTSLLGRMGRVAETWRNYALRWGYMTIIVNASALAAPIVPVLLMMPKYLSDPSMTFGTVMQAATAFGTVQAALAWFTSNFARLSEWYAAASRVAELNMYIQAAASPGAEQSRIEIKDSDGGQLCLKNVGVKLHTGKKLITDAEFTISSGEMVMVTGKSGIGKSTLLRAIAGLWPWGEGTIFVPPRAQIAFASQRPYLPAGTLKAALTYPMDPSDYPDDVVVRALELCDLKALAARLQERGAWDRMLSGSEQQCVAFARLIIQKPSIIILDEATSALDEEIEARLMELFKTELYETSVIGVAHSPSLVQYYSRQITLSREKAGVRVLIRMGNLTGWAKVRAAMARRAKAPVT